MSKLMPEVKTRKTTTDKKRNKEDCLLDADNDFGMSEEKRVVVSDMEDKRQESKNRGCKRKNNREGMDELRCNTLQPKREKNDTTDTLQELEFQTGNEAETGNSFLETNILQHLENEETKKALTTVLYLQMKDAIRRLTEGLGSSTDLSHPSAGCLFHHNGCKDFVHPPEIPKSIIGQLENKVTKAEGSQLEGYSDTSLKKSFLCKVLESNLNVRSNSDGINKGVNKQLHLDGNGSTQKSSVVTKDKAEVPHLKLNEIKLEETDQDQPSNASLQMSDEALNVKLAAEALSLLRNNGRSVCHENEEYDKCGPRTKIQASYTVSCCTSPKPLEKQKDVKKSSAMKPRTLFDATLEITDAVTGAKIPFESLQLDNNHSTGIEENKSDRSVTFRSRNGQKTECVIPETLLHLSDTVTCIKVPLKAGARCTIIKTKKPAKSIRSHAYEKIIQVTNAAAPEKMAFASKMRENTTMKANVRINDFRDTSTSVKIPLEAVDLSKYFRDGGQDHSEYSKLLKDELKSADNTEFRILDLSQYHAKKSDQTGCSESQKPDLQMYGKTSKYPRHPLPKAKSDRIDTFSVPPDDVRKIKLPNIFMNKILLNANTQTAADVKAHQSRFQLQLDLNKSDCQKNEIDSTFKIEETEDIKTNLCHGSSCETSCDVSQLSKEYPPSSKNSSNQEKTVKETAENPDSHILTVIKSEPVDILELSEEENKNRSSLDQPAAEHTRSPDRSCPSPHLDVKTSFDMSLLLKNGDSKIQTLKPESETSAHMTDNLNAVKTHRDTFSLLINDEMILRILKHTNVKLALLSSKSKNRNCFKQPTTQNELKAFLGLLLISGALRQNTTNIPEIWSECFGAGIYRATFHEPRFVVLSKCICLGDITSQDNRISKSEFPQGGKIWEEYLKNCKTHSSPSITKTETIDDDCGQLYSTARKTVNMPLRILCSMLDGAGVRGLAIFRRQNPSVKICQREYLKQVGMSLVTPHLQSRMKKVTLRRSIRELIESILNKKNEYSSQGSTLPNENALIKQKRCQLCPWNRDRKTKHRCVSCFRAICKKHRSDMCVECGKNVG